MEDRIFTPTEVIDGKGVEAFEAELNEQLEKAAQ